jgi:hypothetical protein
MRCCSHVGFAVDCTILSPLLPKPGMMTTGRLLAQPRTAGSAAMPPSPAPSRSASSPTRLVASLVMLSAERSLP